MKKIINALIFLFFIGLLSISVSCSSGSSTSTASSTDTGTETTDDGTWYKFIPVEYSDSTKSLDLFSIPQKTFEIDKKYYVFASTANPLKSYLFALNEIDGSYTSKTIDGYYILKIEKTEANSFVALTLKSSDTLNYTICLIDTDGNIEEKFTVENEEEYTHLFAYDSNTVYLTTKNSGIYYINAYNLDGTLLWKKTFANELDPDLAENDSITVAYASELGLTLDKNIFCVWGIYKKDNPDISDYKNYGNSFFILDKNGNLTWAKADYYAALSSYQYINFYNYLPLSDGTFLINTAQFGGFPGIDFGVRHYDSQGDLIDIVAYIDHGENYIYAYNPEDNTICHSTSRAYTSSTDPNATVSKIYKINIADGSTVWSRDIALDPKYDYRPESALLCSDKGYLFTTSCYIEETGQHGVLVLKTDKDGNGTF